MILNAYQSHMTIPLLRRAIRPNRLKFRRNKMQFKQWYGVKEVAAEKEMGCHICPIPMFVSISNGSCELSLYYWLLNGSHDPSFIFIPIHSFEIEEWRKKLWNLYSKWRCLTCGVQLIYDGTVQQSNRYKNHD